MFFGDFVPVVWKYDNCDTSRVQLRLDFASSTYPTIFETKKCTYLPPSDSGKYRQSHVSNHYDEIYDVACNQGAKTMRFRMREVTV